MRMDETKKNRNFANHVITSRKITNIQRIKGLLKFYPNISANNMKLIFGVFQFHADLCTFRKKLST
jgi:hypothetical protein